MKYGKKEKEKIPSGEWPWRLYCRGWQLEGGSRNKDGIRTFLDVTFIVASKDFLWKFPHTMVTYNQK